MAAHTQPRKTSTELNHRLQELCDVTRLEIQKRNEGKTVMQFPLDMPKIGLRGDDETPIPRATSRKRLNK